MVPRVQQSGGKVRYGKTREDVKRYLKWAYSEAANVIARYHQKYAFRHVGQLYARIREKGPSEGCRSGRKAPRGSHLVGAPHRTTLSGSSHLPVRAGDGGVNAAETHGARAREVIAGRPRKTLCPLGAERCVHSQWCKVGDERKGEAKG